MSSACDNKPVDDDDDEDGNEAFFPSHHELTSEKPDARLREAAPETSSSTSSKLAEECLTNILVNALELDKEDIAEGRVEEEEEEELDDDAFKDVNFPLFDDDQLQWIQNMQDDEAVKQYLDLLKEDAILPSKLGALVKPINVQNFFRHKSLFQN